MADRVPTPPPHDPVSGCYTEHEEMQFPANMGSQDRIIQLMQRRKLRARKQNQLLEAIRQGDRQQVVSELEAASSQGTMAQPTFDTALETAITADQPDIAFLLLENGVCLSLGHLLTAASFGAHTVLERMMNQLSWPINERINGQPLLTRAVRHEGTVRWLLQRGADPNGEDLFAETPLSRAAEDGPMTVINMLLLAGADVTKGAPLQKALRRDAASRYELIEQLLSLGAPVNKLIGSGSEAWWEIGLERATALHYACEKGDIDAIKLLLRYGADPNFSRHVREDEIPGSSPFDRAKAMGNGEVLLLLETTGLCSGDYKSNS